MSDGHELLTDQELVALVPETAREGHIHRMMAPAVIAKRLGAMEETTNPTSRVIPLKAKQSEMPRQHPTHRTHARGPSS